MDFNDALSAKYSIMAQQANAQSLAAQGQFNLANAQAGVIPRTTDAQVGLMGTQGADNLAHAGLAKAQTDAVPLTTAAQGLSALGQYQDSVARAGYTNTQTSQNRANLLHPSNSQVTGMGSVLKNGMNGLPSTQQPTTWGLDGYQPQQGAFGIMGNAKGTARVPGKGDGTVDTQPAMLAPGEAVLNKPAAENVGRGLIAHLNAHGAAQMGMVPATAKEQAGKSHAKGTSKVMDSSKKAPLMTPQMLQMLMQMQGGGAGAPGGGGGILTAAPQAQQLGMP